MADQDQLNNIRLRIQLIKLKNYPVANPLLVYLNKTRETYGLWVKCINLLHMFLESEDKLTAEEREVNIANIVTQMEEECKKIDPNYKLIIEGIHKQRTNIVDIAKDVMNIFESEISRQVQGHKLAFEKELYDFVKKEQERIDRIIE